MFRVYRVNSKYRAISLFVVGGLVLNLVIEQSYAASSDLSGGMAPSVVISESYLEAKDLYKYGLKLFNGRNSEKDLSKAYRLFKQSAKQGYPQAGYQLGIMYRDGSGVARNKNESIKWLRRAASWGVREAQFALDELLSSKLSSSKAKNAAAVSGLNEEQSKAIQGSTAGDQYRIAMMLIDNDEQDYDRAIPFLKNAAASGHLESQYELGMIYKDGKGADKDHEQAKIWLKKAAEKGLVKARSALREVLAMESGNFNLISNKNRFKLSPVSNYVSQAQSGDVEAQYRLGMMYIKGDIIDRNPGKGLMWLRRAAQLNSSLAQLTLGELLYKGVELDRNYEESAKWFQKAAINGDAKAQYLLANMYRKGVGLVKDRKLANKWYRAAAKQGHEKARDQLAGL